LNAFQQKFPKARHVEWAQRKDSNFEVDFNIGLAGRDQKALISPEGRVLKHEEELSSSGVPEAVKNQLNTKFGGYRLDEVTKIDEAGKITYLVDLESRSGNRKVLFDAGGNMLSF